MIEYKVFDTYFDVTPNGKVIFKYLFNVKADNEKEAIELAKQFNVKHPIVELY